MLEFNAFSIGLIVVKYTHVASHDYLYIQQAFMPQTSVYNWFCYKTETQGMISQISRAFQLVMSVRLSVNMFIKIAGWSKISALKKVTNFALNLPDLTSSMDF